MAVTDLTVVARSDIAGRPLPEVFNSGSRRKKLNIHSMRLADWLGVSRSVMESEIHCMTWYSERKWLLENCRLANGGALRLNPLLRTYTEEKNYWLGHKFAIRVCKRFDPAAVPALQQAFADHLRFLALPKLSVDIDYDHGHICYQIENALYHDLEYIYNAVAFDLINDAEKYERQFTKPDGVGRSLAVSMNCGSKPMLDIRIFNAKDFVEHKDRALLRIKRLIGHAVSTYHLSGMAA